MTPRIPPDVLGWSGLGRPSVSLGRPQKTLDFVWAEGERVAMRTLMVFVLRAWARVGGTRYEAVASGWGSVPTDAPSQYLPRGH
jgi:hypothetical protein